MNPFDIVNSINDHTEIELEEKDYVAFMVNRALSYHPDVAHLANDMNGMSHIPPLMQYKYLLCTVRPRKRFGKWSKKKDDEFVEDVAAFYQMSQLEAKKVLRYLTPEQLHDIRNKVHHVGVVRKNE